MKQRLTRVLLAVMWCCAPPVAADALIQSQALRASTIVQYYVDEEKVGVFLAQHHAVVIDGEPVDGILDSVNFLERTLNSSRVIDPPEPLNLDAAIIGTIFVYPRNGLPQTVVMDWDLWDERI